MAEDNIIFEEMKSPISGTKWKFPSTDNTSSPNIIKGRYYSLYSELCDKCNPAKFMSEYDHDRIAIANDIYTQTMASSFYDDDGLKELRKRAMTELGIKFSTEKIYEELTNLLKPTKYTGTEKFNDANDLYFRIINNADDIEELERIKEEAKDFYPRPQPPEQPESNESNLPIDEDPEKQESNESNLPIDEDPKKEEDPEGDVSGKSVLYILLAALILISIISYYMYQLGHQL